MIINVSMPVLVAALIATGAIPEKAHAAQVASVSGAMIQPSEQRSGSEPLLTPFGLIFTSANATSEQSLQVASAGDAQGVSRELLLTPFGPVYYPPVNECTA